MYDIHDKIVYTLEFKFKFKKMYMLMYSWYYIKYMLPAGKLTELQWLHIIINSSKKLWEA